MFEQLKNEEQGKFHEQILHVKLQIKINILINP